MFWEIRGKRGAKQGRWMIESDSEIGAETKAKWHAIEVAVILPMDDSAPPPESLPSSAFRLEETAASKS